MSWTVYPKQFDFSRTISFTPKIQQASCNPDRQILDEFSRSWSLAVLPYGVLDVCAELRVDPSEVLKF